MLNRRRVVAVVDDDPSVRKGLERLLHAYGFQPQGFASAEDFLDSQAAGEADCLILDVHLCGMSGIELRKHLTASGSPLPVIFISAFEDESTQRATEEAGCIAFLHKPFVPGLLISAIEQAVN
jgi:FixJ family two-component response regulator